MADVTSGCTIDSWTFGSLKVIWVETADTVDAADYITIDMKSYGGLTLEAVDGWKHTTTDSVVVVERMTTSVSGTTITATVPGGTSDDKRVAMFYCKSR